MSASQHLKKGNTYFREARDSGSLPAAGWRHDAVPHGEQRYVLDKAVQFWENEPLYKMK